MSEEKKTLKQNVKELFDGCLTIPNLISVIRFCLIPGESIGLCPGSQLLGNSLIFSGLAFQLCPKQHLVED